MPLKPIRKGEEYYVAKYLEISVATQGKTIGEAIVNLKGAVAGLSQI